MKLLDARRLTGLNVIWERPCAIVDVEITNPEMIPALVSHWQQQVQDVLHAIGWTAEQTTMHEFTGGISLALSAPIDCMYSAVEIAEWAYHRSEKLLIPESDSDSPDELSEFLARLQTQIAEEQNPDLLALKQQARAHQVAFLWDDDLVSVGYGKGSQTWPVTEIPNQVEWQNIHNIPLAMITGTNGKTTTVRMTSQIMQAAGDTVGISSTDWIGINNDIIERGDYSGPGGARSILRQASIDKAILETARGGALRRGLGVARADVALITNISEDHLGDFGSRTVEELLAIKWLVMQALDERSIAILNADDPMLVAKSANLNKPELLWFSLDPEKPLMQEQAQQGKRLVSVIEDHVARYDGQQWVKLCAINSIPLTLNGIARHNIANALAAASVCVAMQIPDAAIIKGLQSMTASDNPGRCNLFKVNNCEVLLDFAHNPEGISSILEIARQHPAKRRFLCFGQAGDRTDELIRDLARTAWASGLEHVFICEMADYYRGRESGEVYKLLRDELLNSGARADQVTHTQRESESLELAMAMAGEGDLIIMLALSEAKSLLQHLHDVGKLVS